MPRIEKLEGHEILDSRGRPTVLAACTLAGGARASASVPSGASTGAAEAHELRDRDPTRYDGLGCRTAAKNISTVINAALAGQEWTSQQELDRQLVELDGTPNKAHLGANALLAVSLAFARASAVERGVPLYRQFADILGVEPARLPRMTINLFSGGAHAGGQVPIQDVLVVPAAPTIDEGLAITYAVYQSAARLTARRYGMRALTADEGGLAPPFPSAEAMIEDAVTAIRDAGYKPGRDVALAVDVASSHFYVSGQYQFAHHPCNSAQMIEHLQGWLESYPIVSLEDGLAQEDWANWTRLTAAIGGRVLVLGDDLLCTNPQRIRRAIATNAANALLLKVNQIGTLSEAAEAYSLARSAGWQITVSARSGETEDDWLADLAVGWNADQIKVGSINQSERLAKYNRLLLIERETGFPVNPWYPL